MLSALPLALKHITIKFAAVFNSTDMDESIRLFAQGMGRQTLALGKWLLIVIGAFLGYEEMVTKRVIVDDVVKRGFKELIEHKDDHIKILVTPKADLLKQ